AGTGGTPASGTIFIDPVIASSGPQRFNVSQADEAMKQVTITMRSFCTTGTVISAANDVRIRIPSTFNMSWDTGLTTATIGGAASAKVSTSVTYEDVNKTLVLDITSDLAAGDVFTVDALEFTGFSAVSSADYLELEALNDGNVVDEDDSRSQSNNRAKVIEVYTEVDLVELRATAGDGAVLVEWETGSELENLGFHLYRSQDPTAGYRLLNARLVGGLGNSVLGGRYYFIDRTATNGTRWFYLLEDVETTGRSRLHGPTSALPLAAAWFATPDPALHDGSGEATGDAVSPEDPPPGGPDPPQGRALDRDVTLVEEGPGGLLLVIRPPAPVWGESVEGATRWETVSMDGYASLAETGRPCLPTKGVLLPAGEAERMVVEVLREKVRERRPLGRVERARPLEAVTAEGAPAAAATAEEVAATAVVLRRRPMDVRPASGSPLGGDGSPGRGKGSADAPEGPARDAGRWQPRFYPEATARAGGILDGGTVRLGRLVIHPVLYDERSGVAVAYEELVVRVRFEGVRRPPAEEPGPALETQWALARRPALKLAVAGSGLCRLGRADLAAAGFDLSADPRRWRLYREGRELAIRVEGEADGVFDEGDLVWFHAPGHEDIYSATDCLWLVAGEGMGLRAQARGADPTGVPGGPTDHLETRVFKTPRYYGATVHGDPARDRWYWDSLSSTFQNPRTLALALDAVAPVADGGLVRYVLQGRIDSPAPGEDHHTRVSLNGQPIDDVRWDGAAELDRRVSVPRALLLEGANTITFEIVRDTPIVFDAIWLERVELTWWRSLQARSDELDFLAAAAGAVEVSGFGGPDVVVWDVTDPARPAPLGGAVVLPDGTGTNAVRFAAQAGHRYRAARASSRVRTPPARLNRPSRLHESSNQADWIAVAPAALLGTPPDPLAALAAHRRARGLTAMVVDLEDVLDEFSYGRMDAFAIRAFVRRALGAWTAPAPRYLLLAGDGTYDYRDYLGRGGHAFHVPAPPVDTEFFVTATDHPFEAVLGEDAVPDLAVGRIPAASLTDLERAVAKTIAYETAPPGEAWQRRALLLADYRNEGYFARTSDAQAALLRGRGMEVERLDGASGAAATAVRARLLSAVDEGLHLVGFQGHGSTDYWTVEKLLRASDASVAANGSRLPLIVAANCYTGGFTNPYLRGLGEAYAVAPAGAVACWMPAGKLGVSGQVLLTEAFYSVVFEEGVRELGTAVRLAKTRLAAGSADRPDYDDVSRTFVLLGDPALRLR
ncbi:MAG: hypothetical protein HY722_13465, partial [Planctomycetes bacterium]|nr:hypothetical protein [Planctomycetota bacterium]